MFKLCLIILFTSCSQQQNDREIENILVRYCKYENDKDKEICPRQEKNDRNKFKN